MDKKNFFKKNFQLNDKNGDLTKQWFVYWNVDGKRQRRYGEINKGTTRTLRYALARKLIISLEAEYKKELKKKRDPKFSKIERHLAYKEHLWRKKTYQSICSHFNVFSEWLALRPITKDNIRLFFEHLVRKGINPTTYNNYLRGMTAVFKAVKIPYPQLDKLKNNPTPAAYFLPSQIRYLSKEIPKFDENLWLYVQFVYYCFLRPGNELRLLRVGDILLEEKKLLVRGENAKNGKQQYVTIPKPFLPIIEDKIGDRNPTGHVFFRNKEDQSIGRDYYSKLHRKCLLELGFDTNRYKLYSWKHTGAVMAVKAGIHIKQLQIQLRHHSLDQVNQYLRQLGVEDIDDLHNNFPAI